MTAVPNEPPYGRRAPLAAYANYFEVGHNAFEFLIDFGQFQPDADDVTLHTRMATGPVHAKLLSALLAGAVARFEAEHGEIADVADADHLPPLMPLSELERRAAALRQSRFAENLPHPTKR